MTIETISTLIPSVIFMSYFTWLVIFAIMFGGEEFSPLKLEEDWRWFVPMVCIVCYGWYYLISYFT